jgi:sentrin-specific protease 1
MVCCVVKNDVSDVSSVTPLRQITNQNGIFGYEEEKQALHTTSTVSSFTSPSSSSSSSYKLQSFFVPPSQPKTYSDYFQMLKQKSIFESEQLKIPKRDDSIIDRINEEMKKPQISSSREWNSDLDEEDDEDRYKKLIHLRKAAITKEEKVKVDIAFRGPKNDSILIEKFNIPMTKDKFSCLSPSTWLNDEVINFYMSILQERDDTLVIEYNKKEKDEKNKKRTSHYFNSFFFTKLLENGFYNYANVKRWSRKFDIFTKEKVFIPVNLHNTHWTLVVIYIQKKEIHYYDSMSGSGKTYLDASLQWLIDEGKEKKNLIIKREEWKLFDKESHVPQQRNGYDCGMFTILCADYCSDDLPLKYNQQEMSDNRYRIGAAILRGSLTY